MFRISLPISAMLAACTPSSQKDAMASPSPDSEHIFQNSSISSPTGDRSGASDLSGRDLGDGEPVDLGPAPASVAVAKNAALDRLAGSPEAAVGRRILSTAFVRLGPDGHLTVELRNGRVVILRDVVMRPKDYCGVQVAGDSARAKYCGAYAEVAAARPGGALVVNP